MNTLEIDWNFPPTISGAVLAAKIVKIHEHKIISKTILSIIVNEQKQLDAKIEKLFEDDKVFSFEHLSENVS